MKTKKQQTPHKSLLAAMTVVFALTAHMASFKIAVAQTPEEQTPRKWTGGFVGLGLELFGYNAEGQNATHIGELETRVGTISGFLGYDWQLSEDFLIGVEMGTILSSSEAQFESSDLTYKIGSGSYVRSRIGFTIDPDPAASILVYGIFGTGSYKGEYNLDNWPSEFLLPNSMTTEAGVGVEFLFHDETKGPSTSLRLEYSVLNFATPEGVTNYEANSSKAGLGFVGRF